MRISKLKLSGFKSFVDPTTLNITDNLTGVVGPNGCGKSNIVDAVLWVMGESSAKYLRGDQMTDVIFKGSSTRKPVGQASVEVVFDNSLGALGGQYAGYNEIAIKRLLNRDGASHYYLNNARCRRRDITHLFLGTGLGPRSYSVIEQGMISKLIEAKPDDLRAFIEEAAGISKYKERRRETENSIRHTTDNLSRLNDIREELETNVRRLERQAKAAEKFKGLKQEERRQQAELLALGWRQQQQKVALQEQTVNQQAREEEGIRTQLRGVETGVTQKRETLFTANEQQEATRKKHYELAASISRLEQTIQHAKERKQRLRNESDQLQSDLSHSQEQIAQDQERLAEFTRQLQILAPKMEEVSEQEKMALQALEQAEQGLREWHARWDEFNRQGEDLVRQEEGARTQTTHVERQLNETLSRIEAAREEKATLNPEQCIDDISRFEAGHAQAAQQSQLLKEERDNLQQAIADDREEVYTLAARLDDLRAQQHVLTGRLASLNALQQSALGKDLSALNAWLDDYGLSSVPRLAEMMTVETGWERALETVLSSFLDALCLTRWDDIADHLQSVPQGRLSVLDCRQSVASNQSENVSLGSGLKQKVACDFDVTNLIQQVYLADDLDAALALRHRLQGQESVVTKDGDWMGRNWVRICRDTDQGHGVLAREREIKALKGELTDIENGAAAGAEALRVCRERLTELEAKDGELHQQVELSSRQLSHLNAELAAARERYEQTRKRAELIQTQIETLLLQENTNRHDLEQFRAQVDKFGRLNQERQDEREGLFSQRSKYETAVREYREQWEQIRETKHGLALESQAFQTQRTALEQGLGRNQALLVQLQEKQRACQNDIEETQAPGLELDQELQAAIAMQTQVDSELRESQGLTAGIEQRLRELESERAESEKALDQLRGTLEQAKLELQTSKVRMEGLVEQLGELDYTPELLIEALPDDADTAVWQEKLEHTARRIQRLGAINLAAIDEFAEASERKGYLDQQYQDLTEALDTLQNAIAKMDKETRSRFKETYDRLNSGFQAMFPRLFGGGKAYLELIGNDLLETGVSVMAMPPGKKNSTIHLLSGGEKALTAIALVFAIFELNPAPFCLLDEVDAPLDDANVGRLCELLRSMAERVQFVVVTHHKITMEMVSRLVGVTMQEAGVSRLVAVDIDEAVEMAVTA